jgi:hypothetical protein
LADKNIYSFSAILVYICAHRSEKEVILNLKNNGYMQNTLITFQFSHSLTYILVFFVNVDKEVIRSGRSATI